MRRLILGLLLPVAFALGNNGPTSGPEGLNLLASALPDNVGARLACFGDFNNDKFADVFLVSADNHALWVFLWSEDDFKFLNYSTAAYSFGADTIVNVAASDFNHDGRLDALVTTKSDKLYLLTNEGNKLAPQSWLRDARVSNQVLLLDFNGDTHVDFLGIDNATGELSWWKNDLTSWAKESVGFTPSVVATSSSAFIDMDGDCSPDLVLVGDSSFEVHTSIKTGGSFTSTGLVIDLPPSNLTRTLLTFVDFDRDGNIDVVFPQRDETGADFIHVLFSTLAARTEANMCHGKPPKFEQGTGPASGKHLIYALPKDVNFMVSKSPLRLRTGDINSDGFPDLVAIVNDTAGVVASVWINEFSSSGASRTLRRMNAESLTSETLLNAEQAAFFDLGENGKVDLLVQTRNPDDQKVDVHAVFNNLHKDAYFLKLEGLNGLGPDSDPKPYGVNHPGITTMFAYTDMDSDTIIRIGGQLSQSAYEALEMPSLTFGLGRTSNYISTLNVGLRSNQDDNWNGWISIMPNARLFMFPFPIDDPSKWTLELFISPSEATFGVAMACLGTLVFTGLGVAWFHRKEKRIDAKEKEQRDINSGVFFF